MPVYLLHGFRWPRAGMTGVRVHSIIHDIEDCSPEYIQNPYSQEAIRESFRKLFPDIMQHLENPKTGQKLEFLEQYDPEDEYGPNVVSQPYAFVGDKVVTIAEKPTGAKGNSQPNGHVQDGASTNKDMNTSKSSPSQVKAKKFQVDPSALSVNVEEVMSSGAGVTPQAWEALAELRDKLAEGEKIGWWVVYNGDPERSYDDSSESGGDEEYNEQEDDLVEEEADADRSRTPTREHVVTLPHSKTGPHDQHHQQQRPRQHIAQLQKELPAPDEDTAQIQARNPMSTSTYHQQPKTRLDTKLSVQKQTEPASTKATTSTSTKSPRGREPPPVTLPIRPATAGSTSPTTTRPNQPLPPPLPITSKSKQTIPEPPKAKETAKKEGLRKKFFGKKGG